MFISSALLWPGGRRRNSLRNTQQQRMSFAADGPCGTIPDNVLSQIETPLSLISLPSLSDEPFSDFPSNEMDDWKLLVF